MVTSAQAGIDVEQALTEGNTAFDAITDRIGREQQKAAYEEFLALPGAYYDE